MKRVLARLRESTPLDGWFGLNALQWLAIALGTLLLILASCSSSQAAVQDRRDGNWWRELPVAGRVYYVIGILDGLETSERMQREANLRPGLVVLRGKATAGQLTEGLNRFYSDFRNRSVLVCDGFQVVWSATSGASEEQISDMTRRYRHTTTTEP